jgi:hypothetical protein
MRYDITKLILPAAVCAIAVIGSPAQADSMTQTVTASDFGSSSSWTQAILGSANTAHQHDSDR